MSDACLATTQIRFQNYLLTRTQSLDNLIPDDGRAPRDVRLNIYANAYRARMVEVAGTDYAQLKAYLGDEAFEKLIHAYLARHPSRQPTLRWFGAGLPKFLHRTSPYAGHRDLYELAKFEWVLCDAFDAADAVLLTAADMAALTPPDWVALTPKFHPSLQCLRLTGNLPELWQALSDGQPPPALSFRSSPRVWLVWRQDLRLLFRIAKTDEARCLRWFIAGATFAEVCERLSRHRSEQGVPRFVAGLFRQWLADGLLIRENEPRYVP